MRFDSLSFWIFFCIAWLAWRKLPFHLAKRAALALSLFFYAWWSPYYLPLIVFSAAIDYQVGGRLAKEQDVRARKRWLRISLLVNLGMLAFFKYMPFLVGNAAALLGLAGGGWEPSFDSWVIPVGISFYTFQTLSYTIDIYRRRIEPAKSFSDFLLFVSFFPQLVAGPIVRASQLLPQFESRRRLTPKTIEAGLYFCIGGLFLKLVVADNLGPAVERVFNMQALESLSPVQVWLGVIYFCFQIFADFAGYSGIAIGLAYLMGLRFPQNFRYPFLARGPSEFWSRWHITLSQWLRDYLYIPLGGNRGKSWRTGCNLMATMLLGGLWHGAAWTFVAWGALHGLALWMERAWRGSSATRETAPPTSILDGCSRLLQILCFFLFLQITWVFFRAQSFPMAALVLERMLIAPFREPVGFEHLAQARHLLLILPVVLLHLAQLATEWRLVRKHSWLRATAAAGMLCLLVIVERVSNHEFIYFQF